MLRVERDNRDFAAFQSLLIRDVLVAGQQGIEAGLFRGTEKLPVRDAGQPNLLNGLNIVFR